MRSSQGTTFMFYFFLLEFHFGGAFILWNVRRSRKPIHFLINDAYQAKYQYGVEQVHFVRNDRSFSKACICDRCIVVLAAIIFLPVMYYL